MNIAFKHEIKNFAISTLAMALTVYVFKFAVSTGFAYQLARLIDRIRIQLGLMPEHVLPKLIGNFAYSIVPVNITIFIIINFVFGVITFKLIKKRRTKYSGPTHGAFMSFIFLIVGSILTVLSRDPFNWLAVISGFPITLFIQVLLATILLNEN